VRYVDLRRRRHETGSPEPASPRKEGPYPLLALGFVLGVIVSFLFYAGGAGPVGGLLLLIATGALAGYLVWLLTERHPRSPKTGGEKQFRMPAAASRRWKPR
jgi:hypothetical protein